MFAKFPIMFFAVIMGLCGFALATLELGITLQNEGVKAVFMVVRLVALGLFVFFTLCYVMKIFSAIESLKDEICHPIKINFFATFSISLMLLAKLFEEYTLLYDVFFGIGLVLQTFLTFYVIAFWIRNNMEIKHSNPAWFIPIVGNIIVVASGKKEFGFLWYYFDIAMFFYIVLFTIIFYRILFHDQLAQKFIPTLFIMLAPPSMGFTTYIKLESYDFFAQFLFSVMLFFVFLFFFLYKSFLKLKFFLSWWAFTFPSAAVVLAVFTMYEIMPQYTLWLYFGIFLYVLLCVIMCIVIFFTIKGVADKSVFED